MTFEEINVTFWQKMAPINKKNANHVMSIIVYFWRKEFMERLFVLVFFLFLIVVDLEVSEFIRILGCGHYTKPISQVILLKVLLSQILQVSLAERNGRC